MTLRLSEEQNTQLAQAAAREGVSKHEFIVRAALGAAKDRARVRNDLLHRIVTEDRNLLNRLGTV